MPSIKETAENYETGTTELGNVADLKKVNVNFILETREFGQNSDNPFKVTGFEYEEKFIRVPASVVQQLKVLLEDNPNLEYFKVLKSGTGMGTTYTVKEVTQLKRFKPL